MNKKCLLAFFFASLPLAAGSAFAQSSRWGIMVNEKAKSCATFWEGNSCTKVTVPADWKPVLPVWDPKKEALILSHAEKHCALGKLTGEQCCVQFGFKFDKDFKPPQEATAKRLDSSSECYQLPASAQH